MNWIKAKYSAVIEWVCWNAWNRARKRELARRARPNHVALSTEDLSPDQRRIYANEARQVLENRHFLEAFGSVEAYLEAKAQACDVGGQYGRDNAARIIESKQLLTAVRRELERKLNDGYMAEVEIVELEKRRGLRRFVR